MVAMADLGPRRPLPNAQALAVFGWKVRARREELGLSQRACADGHGFSFAWLAQVERGELNPTLASLLDLADALEISLSNLVGDLGAESRRD